MVALGAAATVLFAACSSVTQAPEPAVVEAPAAPPSPVAPSTVPDAEPASRERQRAQAQQSAQTSGFGGARQESGASAGAATPTTDTIVVTGSRVRRDDFSSPTATTVVTGDDMRNLGAVSVANLRGLNQASGARAPLSRVEPGEELWIISQPPAAAAMAAVADDALGPGVMIARFIPAVFDDVPTEPQTIREIPLPLKHTDVDAKVQGYVGTVEVTQQFENPYDEKIEAVYMFPLPEKAAISEFVMTIGDRNIRGILREKEEARAIYRQARAQGYRASLLTQHRPNVFEQKVANIEPGKQIDVNITYYETLSYSDGWYSFNFPTVVGPRYNPPGSPDPLVAVPQTNTFPTRDDAIRYLPPGTRSAHDISIAVELDAGVAIEEIESSHELAKSYGRDDIVRVSLADGTVVPDEDFRLRFRVAGETIKSSLLTYVDEESDQGYFTLMLYPPADLESLERQPLELVFVLDCSGSMSGEPIEQAKSAIVAALDRLGPHDSFQIIRFSQNASQFGPAPVAATPENLRAARQYVRNLSGSGGTQMIEGVKAALDFPHDDERLRFVTFLTDGYIGNEAQILDAIDARLDASRIFSFGVGSSPNRYLLERMASTGRGVVAYLSLEDSGGMIMDAFFDRIAHPAMIDVDIDWGDMDVADVYPATLPDLFVGRPVIVTGRFTGRPNDLTFSGRAANARVAVDLDYDRRAPQHEFLPNLWARLRIAELNDRLAVNPADAGPLGKQIRETALAYNLMSDYTSFIAVDAAQRTAGQRGTTVFQGVPVPDGVSYDTTVGP
jgi:Ca-activated chloride channel family protein